MSSASGQPSYLSLIEHIGMHGITCVCYYLQSIYLGGTKVVINCCKPGGLKPRKRMSLLLIPDIEVGEKQPRMPGEVLRFLPNW